jgi:dolichol-phosphate mannosyltransferase
VLQAIDFESVNADGYGFQVEMTNRIVGVGAKVVEFPITFQDRTAGVSKMSKSIIGEALFLVLRLWVEDFRGRHERRARGG